MTAEQPPLIVSVRTVRRVLRGGRARKAQAGLMLLWDGSRHNWLEGGGPWLCLIAAIAQDTLTIPSLTAVEFRC